MATGRDTELTIADLKDVKNDLWDARAKWKDIGTSIGVDEGTLDALKGLNDPGDCFGEMMKYWLRGVYDPKKKNSKPRTWRTLIEALRQKVVSAEALAKELEENYPPQVLGAQPVPVLQAMPRVQPDDGEGMDTL